MIKKINHLLTVGVILLGTTFGVSIAQASGGAEIPKQVWPHQGMSGTYDKAALQHGFQVYKDVCAGCHSMNLLSYRNLAELGFNEDEIKAIAAEYTMIDGPNDEGDMFERAGKPFDTFKAPYDNDNQGRYSNNGSLPPDMSLLSKARSGGPDYIFAMLTGYADTAEGAGVHADENGEYPELMEGQYWNKYFPGYQIAMSPPLFEGIVTYSDDTEPSLEQAARDVSQFLAWASEPKLEERKKMGWKVLIFLVILTGLLYGVKRRVWADVH